MFPEIKRFNSASEALWLEFNDSIAPYLAKINLYPEDFWAEKMAKIIRENRKRYKDEIRKINKEYSALKADLKGLMKEELFYLTDPSCQKRAFDKIVKRVNKGEVLPSYVCHLAVALNDVATETMRASSFTPPVEPGGVLIYSYPIELSTVEKGGTQDKIKALFYCCERWQREEAQYLRNLESAMRSFLYKARRFTEGDIYLDDT